MFTFSGILMFCPLFLAAYVLLQLTKGKYCFVIHIYITIFHFRVF